MLNLNDFERLFFGGLLLLLLAIVVLVAAEVGLFGKLARRRDSPPAE